MTTARSVRSNKASSTLSLSSELFPEPAANIGKRKRKTATASTKRKRNTPLPGGNPQAFLPGLSRRGRPRAEAPASAAERAAASRERRLATGARRVELMMDAATVDRLDALAEHLKESRAGVLSWLIVRTAAKLLK
jgi:hypothetical protein